MFAARQELARKRIERATAILDHAERLQSVPDRDETFLLLATPLIDDRELYIERLKHDLDSLGAK